MRHSSGTTGAVIRACHPFVSVSLGPNIFVSKNKELSTHFGLEDFGFREYQLALMMEKDSVVIGGRYELLERVAEGGMAIVWKARICGDAGFCRPVAIKEIKVEYRGLKKYVQMFMEEARIGTELAHPHIVQVLDFFEEGQTYYLVLEWVEGLDLHDFSRAFSYLKQPVPWSLAVVAAVGTLSGLGAAHERRTTDGQCSPVIHRDISPQNILLGNNGTVKLGDFGVARARDRSFALTAPGTVKGKLSYFSPEVAHGKAATPLSDQFALGCVLWESLVGTPLFQGSSDVEIIGKIRRGKIKDLHCERPDIPLRVVRAVHRSLQVRPDDRFPSAKAFAAELSECLRSLGGGLYDAAERLAAAVLVARNTLGVFELESGISASEMDKVTWTQQLNLDTVNFDGPTMAMDAVDPVDLTSILKKD